MILIKVLSGYKGLGTEGEKKLVCILHCSQVGRQNGAHPSVEWANHKPTVPLLRLKSTDLMLHLETVSAK